MAEKNTNNEPVSPSRSGATGTVLGVGNNSLESTTSTSGSMSPKLPISRIFGRSRSSSQQSISKDDSDEQVDSKVHESQCESDKEMDKKKDSKSKSSWFFGHPKSKSGSGWLPLPFSFIMSHQEKNNEIHKIFSQLPGKERLIDDYSCALQRDILIHGRLYITQNWLCFYANIFSWETLLTIPFRTVTSITKERTALLIPNAIQIATTVEKYGFSSFIQRDITYNVIFKVWQNSLLDQPLSPLELVKAARKAWGDSTDVGTEQELWGPKIDKEKQQSGTTHQHSMPTHLEIGKVPVSTSIQTDPPASLPVYTVSKHGGSPNMRRTISTPTAPVSSHNTDTIPNIPSPESTPSPTHPHRGKRQDVMNEQTSNDSNVTGSIEEAGMNTISKSNTTENLNINTTPTNTRPPLERIDGVSMGQDSAGESSVEFEAFAFPDDTAEVPCGCSEHTGRTILNDVYNAEVEIIFQLLFTDSDFYRSFLKARKTTNVEIGEWSAQPDGTRLRDVTFTLSLNYSFGPKFSPCSEHQIYFKNGQPGVRHIVQTDVINGNVPYGDTFYVSCLFCMTRVAHNKTRLRVTSNICFKKNCWGVVKNLIERNAGDGLRSYYNHLDITLKEYLATLPAKRIQKTRRTSRRKQRRQPSVTKEEETSLRKRRGSVSSRSIKSSEKVSEEDAQSISSIEHKDKSSRSYSLPKVNLALTVLLGVLVLSNIALYHQLMGYQSSSTSTSTHTLPFSFSSTQSQDSIKQILSHPDLVTDWPTSPEDWKNLFQQYWEQQEEDKEQIKNILHGVIDALQQVETAISVTRKQLQNKIDSLKPANDNQNEL